MQILQSYEQLSGSIGRKMFFRAQRYPAQNFLEQLRPILHLDKQLYVIHDLSMNGVSFYGTAGDLTLDVGSLTPLAIELDGLLVYKGEGVISRIQPTPRGQKVALRIVNGFLDIPMMVAAHDELVLKREIRGGVDKDLNLVDKGYRQLCSEAVYLLRRYRNMLDRYEYMLGRSNTSSLLPPDFIQECEERFRIEWLRLRTEAGSLIGEDMQDEDIVYAVKRFTEVVLTPELSVAPLWSRCYEKPLGYPGDYEVMNMLYGKSRLGDTAFARMVQQIGLEHPYAVSVRYRKDMIRKFIADCVNKTPADMAPIYITSLGCGPAREVQEYLESTTPANHVHFTFIDQDEQALSFAYSQVYPHVIRRSGRVSVECLHVSFAQLLKEPELLRPRAMQHFIYVSGLFDYLSQKAACSLSGELYKRLAPGGWLALGNFGSSVEGYWEMEYIVDWSLVHRDRKQMLALADGLEADAVELHADPTGHLYLLLVSRP